MRVIQESPDTSNLNLGWHALYTRHQHERTVAKSLSAKGFEVFLPLYNAVHRWKDCDKQVLLPLFPCYVFLRGPCARWLPILTTPGIHSVVAFSGGPAMIPSEEIHSIRRAVDGPLKVEPHPFIRCGDRVRLKAGPLHGLEGILIRKKSLWKLLVSIEMLQRSVAVEVDASTIERISSPKPTLTSQWLPACAAIQG
jgi:transcription antitermination factor NusG